ncbi:MAG: hypothetical protein JEZ03_07865 [Bacteroidales bacterium]|nr:hypothetical protein [Bacteroidales bacterium]
MQIMKPHLILGRLAFPSPNGDGIGLRSVGIQKLQRLPDEGGIYQVWLK